MKKALHLLRGILIFAAVGLVAAAGFQIYGRLADRQAKAEDGAPLTGASYYALPTSDPQFVWSGDAEDYSASPVSSSGMHLSINADPVFPTGSAKGSLNIENDRNNLYAQVVQIFRDDTGDLIYTSETLEPGEQVAEDALGLVLVAGDYPCTAYFNFIEDNGRIVGTGISQITIHIQS